MSEGYHWHIKTLHKSGTPDYPSKNAVHLYHMACGKIISSLEDNNFTQFDHKLVTCKKCLSYLEAVAQKQFSNLEVGK